MICLQQQQPAHRRQSRTSGHSSSHHHQTQPAPPAIAEKTKSAICFLCLFDGLRIPSIRRLIRKPHIFHEMQVRIFDPSFFSPNAQESLSNTYTNIIQGQCDCLVDPSIDSVRQILSIHANNSKNQRIILHYCGYGCLAPNQEGSIYFFTQDRSKYFPILITNLIASCPAPLLMIFDVNNAGSLFKSINMLRENKKLDLFALFSSGADEPLPSSTDLPLDLFSQCLLNPFKTMIWWQMRRMSKSLSQADISDVTNNKFFESFLDSVLEAIAFDVVPPKTHQEIFRKDPAVAQLFRGFFLAQYIFWFFHIKPESIPHLPSGNDHVLWTFFETAHDLTCSNPETSPEHIFELLVTSFMSCPFSSAFPMFSFFLQRENFHERVISCLIDYVDNDGELNNIAARSGLMQAILAIPNPSPESLILLSKLAIISGISPFDKFNSIAYLNSKETDVLKAGMLSICCGLAGECDNPFNMLPKICTAKAKECAPFSAILFGLLAERGKTMDLPAVFLYFIPLLQEDRSDSRATAIYALGYAKSKNSIPKIMEMLNDPAPLVRVQAILAISRIINSGFLDQINDFADKLTKMKDEDQDEEVRNNASIISNQLNKHISEGKSSRIVLQIPENKLVKILYHSVISPHFLQRYTTNVFM